MIDLLLRRLPLPLYWPLRWAITSLQRKNPLRQASTLILKRASRACRHSLSVRLKEIRPIDQPDLSFAASDSMVIDAIFWLGVRGYEGTVARVWTALCTQARSTLEIGGNVGLFTVIGARATSGAYTVVEPVPAVAATLRANLERNAITGVILLEAAVVPGNEPRQVVLNLPDEGRAMGVGAHLVDDVEVAYRDSRGHITVSGLPIGELADGRDLIKIDAEGIEMALLSSIRPALLAARPTLLIEVLPEAVALGAFLAELATDAGYLIHVLPEYGSDIVVQVSAADFTSSVPGGYNSKDVVLSVRAVA